MTSQLKHEEFCLPRPGQAQPRIESYPVYRDDGSRAAVVRCVECGAQTVDGQQVP